MWWKGGAAKPASSRIRHAALGHGLRRSDDRARHVYDYGDNRLKAFDDRGRLRWAVGGPGKGPGEFSNPLDIQVGPRGNVWVLDAGAARIAEVLSVGRALGTMPIGGGAPIHDILPLGATTLATTFASNDTFWVALDSTGAVVGAGLDATPDLRRAPWFLRQSSASEAPDGRWVAVFPFGNLLLLYRGRPLLCQGRLIEGRIVDEYSAKDCGYQRTLRLPVRAGAMTVRNGTFYLEYEDPAPGILALRRR